MKFFYLEITRDPSDVSEVHEQNCPSIPSVEKTYLGPFNNAKEALRKALEKKENVALCPKCCSSEDTSVAFFSHASLAD